MTRAERLYALVEALHAAAPAPVAAGTLAARFGVSRRTILRDVATLQRTGLPLRAQSGRGGGFRVDARAGRTSGYLTSQQLAALAAAVAAVGSPEVRRHGSAALTRLTAQTPALPRGPAPSSPPVAAAEPNPVTMVLNEALRLRRTVLVEYADEREPWRPREVEPYCRLVAGRNEYLLGWCRTRGAVRALRLDRIRAARLGRNAPRTGLDDLPPAERGLPMRYTTFGGADITATPSPS